MEEEALFKTGQKERNESDLKLLNFKELTFSLFNVLTAENQVNTKLTDYFAVNGVVLTETAMKGKIISLAFMVS